MKKKLRKRQQKHLEFISVVIQYHTLFPDIEYPVIKEGVDWYLVKSQGKPIYVFKSLTES